MKRAVVALGLLLASVSHASHYLIVDVPDVIPASKHAALAKQGITSSEQLYERVVTRTARASLAKAAGLDAAELASWARFLDLMQLSGIGPKMVRLLNAAGIDSLAAFKKAEPAALYQRFREVNVGARYSEVIPNADILRGWIDAAQKVPTRLE